MPALLAAGLVALVGCLFLGGTLTAETVSGLPDAGSGTSWGLPIGSFIAETAGVLAFGAALLAAVLIPYRRRPIDAHAAVRARCRTAAASFAGLASVASLVVFVLTVSDLTARPLPAALTMRAIAEVATFGPGLLLLVSAALAAVGAVLSRRAARPVVPTADRHRSATVLPVVVLAASLIPWALGGHTAQAGQDIAASALIVHVLAAGAWIGGLTVIVLFVRGDLLTTVLPRFATLALWCWISIGVSGVITGWLRVGQVADLWTSGYGRLLLVKLLLLGVLGTFGIWHRRRINAGLRSMTISQRGALLRVAAVEVLLMGATMGVATALSATPPPAAHATGHDAAHGTSRIEALAGHRLPVISAENLAVLWRPDVIVMLLVVVALTSYLAAVRRTRQTGRTWPVSRVCWAVGAGVATVLTLNSGVATYDGTVWSVTVAQQAVASVIIPMATVLARPWELFAEHGPLRRSIGALTKRPWLVLAGYAAWSAGCLLTPVALWSVSNHAVLMVVRVGDIIVGTALFTVLLTNERAAKSADRPPRPSPTALLVAWFAVQIGIAAALLFGGAASARSWFGQLNLAWIEVAQDERMAAMLHLGVAVAVLLLVAALPCGSAAPDGASPTRPRDQLVPRLIDAPGKEMRVWIDGDGGQVAAHPLGRDRPGPIVGGSCSESPVSSTSVTTVRRP